MRFERSVRVDASPETAWTAVNDPEQWPSWVSSIREVKKVTEGPLGVGSQFRIRVKAALPVTLHMTVTEFVPGQRVVMQGRVFCTRQDPTITGKKLLLIQPMRWEDEKPIGGPVVAADAVGAGASEKVFWVASREAAVAFEDVPPVDAAVVAIVDGHKIEDAVGGR